MVDSVRRTAAIYARISRDDDNTALGVRRQVEDCVRVAERLGWALTAEPYADYVDNDVSATSGKVRPAYRRMMRDLEAGVVNAMVVWDVDRLTRTPRELEGIIDLADRLDVALASVGGDVDLATPQGRLVARIKGTVARHEVEQMGRRISRQCQERAVRGEPHGNKAYGWDRVPVLDDKGDPIIARGKVRQHDVINPVEAQVIRDCVAAVIQAPIANISAIARDLNERRVPSATGGRWCAGSVRQLLLRPSNCGWRVHRGVVVATGNWEPILTVQQHEQVIDKLKDIRRRKQSARNPKYLLSGIARCGAPGPDDDICGTTLSMEIAHGNQPKGYTCRSCHHLRCNMTDLDEYVTTAIIQRLADPNTAARLRERHDHVQDSTAQRDILRDRLNQAAHDYGRGEITAGQLTTITAMIQRSVATFDADIQRNTPTIDMLDLCHPDIAERWHRLSPSRQRDAIHTLLDITVHPSGRGNRWNPACIQINPR